MSNRSETITPSTLRAWGLPDPGESKKSRGRIIVVGGSRRTPGAVVLAGEASLRVGAGRLGVVVPKSVDAQLGAVIPEAAVFALPDDSTEPLSRVVRDEIARADAVLVGPGFDDPGETRATLTRVAECEPRTLVLDAYALGILPDVDRTMLPDRLILNPNTEETAILLGRDLGDDRIADLGDVAERYDAVVNCYGDIVDAVGNSWRIAAGGPGLGTSGSGDVLAGAIAGMAARGLEPAAAAAWGAWVHARAGDRLTDREGLGFLARDIAAELTLALHETLAPQTSA
ncbi:NAD(P)H-hydrate dehydratase [Microbacterium sp. SLBN-146]|uniref:NAD(P)H-hydrate dehydratase n=1 Tax=Microbacterium sp. SLBN-146 TaxID=2768457 RepID=UPI001154B9AA|nr:NAD(P)H-hydrate dehydratase [Microbacterium sp. SLBN-146]TQJ30777.1 hydroxyethylthiazole kinase-like uncharacterized protein yjeF [Microbacterium sp. SLBN-146]